MPLTERLAIPAWDTEPTPIATWVEALEKHLGPVEFDRDGPAEAWLDIDSRLVRGWAMIEGPHIAAVNFEIEDEDPAAALRDLETACGSIGWELHEDDEAEAEDDD